jgi:hypothetical protein
MALKTANFPEKADIAFSDGRTGFAKRRLRTRS